MAYGKPNKPYNSEMPSQPHNKLAMLKGYQQVNLQILKAL